MPDFDLQIALDRLAEAMLPDDEMRQRKANAVVISQDGGVHSRALAASLPWYRVDVSIPGTAVAGSSVRRVPFPQGGRLRHISLYAKSAPSSDYTIRVTAGGESQYFSLQAGASTAMRAMNLAVNPGSWAIIDVMNAGGAADVEITLQYSVLAGGSSSAGSGGSSSGGGGTAVWGEIGGTLLHQTDLSSALAGKASVSHDHDGTYSPATHTHAYSDLTGTPTIPTTLAALDTTVTGAQLNALKTKVDGIASGATANATNAQLRDRATHTGTQSADTLTDGTTNKAFLATERTKLSGIATGATANATNAQLRDRATHTGAQAISTVTGLQTALDGKAATSHTHATADVTGLDTALSGKASTSHTHSVSDLTASGTRNSTTILYGDNTWKTAPSGGGGVTDHTLLTNIGTNTHAQIDTHVASTGNPHSVTKAQVGLSNVPNTDFTAAVAANTAKISFDSTASTKLAGIAAGAEVNVNADWNASSGDAAILNKPSAFPPSPHDHDERYYTQSEVDALVNQAETHSGVLSGGPLQNTTDISGTYSNMLVLQSVSLNTVIPEITDGTWDVDITAYALVYRSVATGGVRLKIGDGISQWAVGALGRNFPQSNGYTMNTYAAMKGVPHNATLDLRLSGFSTAGTTHCVDYGWKVTARRVG